MKKILIINGPNLNLLGKREPLLYGSESFETVYSRLCEQFSDLDIDYQHHNDEAAILAEIQNCGENGYAGIVLNAAAYTHTSMAIADAVAAIDLPVIELHISNIFARDLHRHHSYISKYAKGIIVGFGVEGYRLAINYFLRS